MASTTLDSPYWTVRHPRWRWVYVIGVPLVYFGMMSWPSLVHPWLWPLWYPLVIAVTAAALGVGLGLFTRALRRRATRDSTTPHP